MDSKLSDEIIGKITKADPNYYIIFYVPECGYSQNALKLLANQNFKGYDINKIPGGFDTLLKTLSNNAELLGYNKQHKTKPIDLL